MALRRPKLPAPPKRAVTAAVAQVEVNGSWKSWKFGNRDWQIEAWRLYDIVTEHRFLANWIGDSISQARLYVTEVDDTGEETGEVTEQRIAALAAIPLGTGGQRDDMLRLAGVDLAVGGECWIVGEGAAANPLNTDGAWFVVTGSAFSKRGDQVSVRRPRTRGGSELVLTDGTDVLIRCWRPHPNDIDQPDSPTRAAIVPLREIELLTKREFAELDSRLTGAGVLFLPEGVDFPRGPDDPEGIAGFMAYLQRAAAASMVDQNTASAMVPIMATVPDQVLQYLDQIKPLNFWSDLSEQITPMKDKAISRLASGFEIPSEVLLGLGTVNHWSAWVISEDGIKRIKPYGAAIADALTQGFLQLALTTMGVANPERYAYAFDWSGLAARPNRLEDALQLHDRFLLSDAEAVKAGAFSEEQMPTTQEKAAQIALKLVQQQPELLTDPNIQRMLGFPEVTISVPSRTDLPAIEQPPAPEEDETDEQDAPNGGNADGPDDDSLSIRLADRMALLKSAPPSREVITSAACKLMIFRALELAGGRLTTPDERKPTGRWGSVPRHELHVRVGPITFDKAAKVTEGAFTHLPAVAADLGLPAGDLERLLSGYVTELLTRGMPHHDDLLFHALSIANRGQGLVAA